MVKLFNGSKTTLQHSEIVNGKAKLITLKPNDVADVPKAVAETWLKVDGVAEHVDPAKAKKEQEELLKEVETLKKELAQKDKEIKSLKAEIAKLQKTEK